MVGVTYGLEAFLYYYEYIIEYVRNNKVLTQTIRYLDFLPFKIYNFSQGQCLIQIKDPNLLFFSLCFYFSRLTDDMMHEMMRPVVTSTDGTL